MGQLAHLAFVDVGAVAPVTNELRFLHFDVGGEFDYGVRQSYGCMCGLRTAFKVKLHISETEGGFERDHHDLMFDLGLGINYAFDDAWAGIDKSI